MYRHFFKRLIDIVLSFIAIVVLLIPIAIISLIILITDPGPIYFKQKRFGKDKKYFKILKFRSMKVDTPDVPTDKLKNPGRKTRLAIRDPKPKQKMRKKPQQSRKTGAEM